MEIAPGAGEGSENQDGRSDSMDQRAKGVDIFQGSMFLGVEDDGGDELKEAGNKAGEDDNLRGGISELRRGFVLGFNKGTSRIKSSLSKRQGRETKTIKSRSRHHKQKE